MTTLSVAPRGSREAEIASLALGIALVGAWPFVLGQFRHGDIYALMGPFAIGVLVTLAFIGRKFHGGRARVRSLVARAGIGAGVGVVMTGATYFLYALAARLFPTLAEHVADLYRASRTESFAPMLAWTLIILIAEEMLWRGPLLPILERRVGRRAAIAISMVTYVAAQSASGSPIVALAAFICGAIWLAERKLTGSIVPSILSHAIWTLVVIHFYPVTTFHPGH